MSSKTWPTLYKESKSSKISQWSISVKGSSIITQSGFVGMKLRDTLDVIKEGKNVGKKNETTPHTQAIAEAQSQFEKQIDRGYVESLEQAKWGENDIEGGYFPMLAHSYDKHPGKVKYPCFVQPKLDGLRATFSKGKFHSRTRKSLPALKHIVDEIKSFGIDVGDLDGEAYNHDYRENFEELVSAIKREKSDNPNTIKVQYHIYDTPRPGNFFDRHAHLNEIARRIERSTHLRFVETRIVKNEKEMRKAYEDFMEKGYEGAMIRNFDGEYENRRSTNLLKLKEFEDSEFKIIGADEGRGALAGCVGAFLCATDEGAEFHVKMKGKDITRFLKECWKDSSLWSGKSLTVQYQGWTRANKVPRFPVGVRIRED